MRFHLGLWEILLILIPAVAIACGLVVACVRVRDPHLVLLASRALLLTSAATAVCCLYHPHVGVRAFAGSFLLTAVGHLLLTKLGTNTFGGRGWPAYELIDLVWPHLVKPERVANWTQGSSHAVSREVGIWCLSFLLGVVCGLFARGMQSDK